MERITNTQSFGPGRNVTNNYGKTVALNNKTITVIETDGEDNQIKQWLSPLEPRHKHQSVQTSRMDGVGGWLLKTNEFREWSGSEGMPKHTVMFCYGHPGVGKTCIRLVRKSSRASGYH